MQLTLATSHLLVVISSLRGGRSFSLADSLLPQSRAGRTGGKKGVSRMATSIPQERPELSIPENEGGETDPDGDRWDLQHELPPGSLPLSAGRSRVPRSAHVLDGARVIREKPQLRCIPITSLLDARALGDGYTCLYICDPSGMCMVDNTSHLESSAPELLPLWVRHGHQVPEELAHDINLSGTLARVKLCEVLDRASLNEACSQAMLGLPQEAASTLQSLLCLQLKLSYLSTKTPEALKEYTHSRDAGGKVRRAEAALLARISSEFNFPRGENSASAILPLLAEHLQLDLAKSDPKTWKAVEAVFERAHPWAVRTECLLVEGCDDRITVPYNAGKTTNKYHCSPVPTPEVVSRSSCTSSSSSRRAFDSADCERHDVLLSWALKKGVGLDQGREAPSQGLYDDGCFTNRMSDIRRRLLGVLGLHRKDVEVFLTPSGSDAEFLPTALACARAARLGHKAVDGPAVTSIVVAAGEVGSGTAGAAGGKHFSKLTPRGVPGHPEHHVTGVPAGDVVVVQMKPRSKSGAFLPCEDLVRSAVHKALSSSPANVVVVHFVAGSKTGICSPSERVLTEMQERYGERLLVVVDACQLRSEEEYIRKYVSLGFLTLVTGSKFYCGPPFCGAVLFPPAALAELEAGHEHLPAGFEDYFTRHEVDSRYSTLRSRLPSWENRGLLLRWASSLANMEAVKSIPKEKLNAFVGSWVEEVRDKVQDKWPYLSLLPEQRTGEPCVAFGGVNTVVPMVVRVPQTSEGPDGNPELALGYDDLRLFHRLLSEDIWRFLPQDLAMEDRAAARFRVLFGQPVKLGGASFGVIRIALGAEMLIDAFCRGHPPLAIEHVAAVRENGDVPRLLAQDRLAVNKCTLMARHWHSLKEAVTGVPATVSAPRTKNGACLETLSTTIKSMDKDDLRLLENLVAARQRELMHGGVSD